jgi:hypothetical protein
MKRSSAIVLIVVLIGVGALVLLAQKPDAPVTEKPTAAADEPMPSQPTAPTSPNPSIPTMPGWVQFTKNGPGEGKILTDAYGRLQAPGRDHSPFPGGC